MAEKSFEKALIDQFSNCDLDNLNLFLKDIVDIQKSKIEILDTFPEGIPRPDGLGFLTRTKFENITGVLEVLKKYRHVRKLEVFPYGIPVPIWYDIKVSLTDQFQNRFQ